jgi:sugar transferase (PEP-CTERM/EpsH1 system associated)
MKSVSRGSSQTVATPLHILHVVFSLEPGGLENGVVNLANGLDRARFRTTICCLERVGHFAERLQPDVAVECLEKRSGFDPRSVVRLAGLLRRVRPDVIHTHNLGPLIYTVLARSTDPRLIRTRILHGEHGALQSDELSPKRLRQRKLFYRFCRNVHTVSGSLREHLIEFGLPQAKISAILNGVDCGRFSPAADRRASREALGLSSEAIVIGAVGRLVAQKRQLLLIEAFARTVERGREDTHLLLLGDGPDKERVLTAIEPHGDRITWAGQRDPAPFYRAMDLLVMPSVREGLSNVLLEAMASGVPCLSHPACGAGEVITDGQNGILRPMESAEDLATALEELLASPGLLGALGQQARRTAVEHFSLNVMVAGYQRLYEQVAG